MTRKWEAEMKNRKNKFQITILALSLVLCLVVTGVVLSGGDGLLLVGFAGNSTEVGIGNSTYIEPELGNSTDIIDLSMLDDSILSITNIKDRTYNGKAQIQTPIVVFGSYTLKEGSDYTLSYSNNTNAGTAKVIITGAGQFTGSVTRSFKINKAANPLEVKAKTATVKYSKVKKKTQKLAASKVLNITKKGQGTVTYTKVSGDKKITISKKTGKVTVKKKTKKKTYKIKVKVNAAGNANYKPVTKTVTFKVKVK